jgi:2-oxoglutarate dehydrogenase complex dihydrolipoamide succinyltransferase (E2) component
MTTKITMPQLGESVNEGTVGHWLKNEGDTVKKDESLVEIITDKVTAELPSPVSGRLSKILAKEDETVRVGAEIAEIDDGAGAAAGDDATATVGRETTAGAQEGGAASARAGEAAAHAGTPNGSRAPQTAVAEKVSPLARRLAQEHNVDLNEIAGTGDGGRVRKEDILGYVDQRAQQPAAASPAASRPQPAAAPLPPAPHVMAGASDELITPTPARRAIAEHMLRSKHTAPHATTLVEVDMTNLARWLDGHKDAFKQREGYGISFQTFAIKAVVEALKEQPYMNASWTDDNKILLRKQINIGVSVALENNLIVPVIRDADSLNIAGIARATSDLVSRARTNKLMPAELQGATFTVNNPGVFGTLISVAIINQPNAGILTMDAVVKRPVVIDDAIAIRHMMYMSLSFDHRILDGLIAARFLGAVKRRLESWGPELDVY